MDTRRGAFRRVFRTRGLVLKIPRLRHPLLGMRCNRWEREMWRKWRLKFKWACLCPVLFADRCGLVVVMPRAAEGVTEEEIEQASHELYPDVTCEWKAADCGRLNGRLVAIDYGLPWADGVKERREYMERFPR